MRAWPLLHKSQMSIEENKIRFILEELRDLAKKSKKDLKHIRDSLDEIQIYLSLAEKSKPDSVVKKSKLSKEECGLTENELKFIEQYSKKSKDTWDGLVDLL